MISAGASANESQKDFDVMPRSMGWKPMLLPPAFPETRSQISQSRAPACLTWPAIRP